MSNATDWGEILLDGKPYVANVMRPVNLNTFPAKLTMGDYSLDSNDLLSSWVISDLTGGNGVAELNEATDTNRYRSGAIYTRYPKQLTKPFESVQVASASGYYPLGNLYNAGVWEWYGSRGTDLCRDDVSLGLAAMTTLPVNPGTPFQGTGAAQRLFIPRGASGHTEYIRSSNTITNKTPDATHPAAQDFLIWDDKLICLAPDGQLWYTLGTASTWYSYGSGAQVDAAFKPLHLISFYNRNDDPTIFIICDSAIFAFDASGPKVWRVDMEMPDHPNAGAGVAVWRGDLYFSAGMDIVHWNGSVQRNIGLSRDDGLPVDNMGYISSLVGSTNSLLAYVNAPITTVQEWSGIGWHQVMEPTLGAATWMGVSRSAGIGYRLYAGSTVDYAYQKMPVNFTNPREAVAAGGYTFGYTPKFAGVRTYRLLTGRFDANMTGYLKLANAVEVDVVSVATGVDVHVYYRLDDATLFTKLNAAPLAAGHNVLPFGAPTADGLYPGVPFHNIELQLQFAEATNVTATPVVRNMVLSFLKLKANSYSWTCNVALEHAHKDRSPAAMSADLQALVGRTDFYAMVHKGVTYRVRVAQIAGQENTADDERGSVQLSIIEIPQKLGL